MKYQVRANRAMRMPVKSNIVNKELYKCFPFFMTSEKVTRLTNEIDPMVYVVNIFPWPKLLFITQFVHHFIIYFDMFHIFFLLLASHTMKLLYILRNLMLRKCHRLNGITFGTAKSSLMLLNCIWMQIVKSFWNFLGV